MPKLKNNRHELFARYVAEGKTQTDAYKMSGFNPKTEAAARNCASRLVVTVAGVRDRIDEIFDENQRKREERAERHAQKYTLNYHLESLKLGAEKALERGNIETYLSAHTRMAKAAGLLTAVDGHQGDVHFQFSNELAETDPNKESEDVDSEDEGGKE